MAHTRITKPPHKELLYLSIIKANTEVLIYGMKLLNLPGCKLIITIFTTLGPLVDLIDMDNLD